MRNRGATQKTTGRRKAEGTDLSNRNKRSKLENGGKGDVKREE